MEETTQKPVTRGLLATINDKGRVEYQPVGQISHTEFLGIGTDIILSSLKDGISSCIRNQMLTNEALKGLTKVLVEMSETEDKGEPCKKESSLESSQQQDSGQSTESSQE
jgi:hypothetical protein